MPRKKKDPDEKPGETKRLETKTEETRGLEVKPETTGKPEEKKELREKKEPKKRVRRSPELLIEELDEKLKKLEVQVYRRNADYIQQIGVEILKMIDYKFAKITKEDREDIKKMTPRGKEIVRDIIVKAYDSMQEKS